MYTDSVLDTANRFVLEPATMTAAERLAAGLQPHDVQLNETTGWYDHLPVVVDFRLEPLTVPEPCVASLALLACLGFHARRPHSQP